MTTTDLPPRRALYFLNPTPPPVLTQSALDAMDKADTERKEQA